MKRIFIIKPRQKTGRSERTIEPNMSLSKKDSKCSRIKNLNVFNLLIRLTQQHHIISSTVHL